MSPALTMRARRTRGWLALERIAGVNGGYPVVRGSHISIDFLMRRWLAGDSIGSLALTYNIRRSLLERGLAEWVGRSSHWRELVPLQECARDVLFASAPCAGHSAPLSAAEARE